MPDHLAMPSLLARPLRAALLAVLSAALLAAAPARAGTANAGLRGASPVNPLAGMRWGVYTGATDGVYPAYAAARGGRRQLMAKIATRPLAFWFGAWFADKQARAAASQYIAQVTAGDPAVLSQLAVFRLDPWEQAACGSVPSAAAQRSYRRWIDAFAAGIGSARVALILQPDLPFALCAPSRVPLELVAYAAQRFTALSHTSVYIDAGAAEWASVRNAAWLLEQAGVRHTRGFALNATQYDSTQRELEFGAAIAQRLAADGVPAKHFVVNTSQNGAPFLYGQYHGNHDNPRVCASSSDRICATLGIPPTTAVASSRWGLSGYDRGLAARYADAYLWIGRPWLDNGSAPFDFGRALGLARSSPF